MSTDSNNITSSNISSSIDSNINGNLKSQLMELVDSTPIVPAKVGRVFMLEQSQNVDVKPAFEYGPIIPLFKSTNGVGNSTAQIKKKTDRPSMWDTEEFREEILKRLEQWDYDPEKDYLLIAGHTIPIVIFIATVVAEWENVQVLFWSSGYEKYVVRKL